MIAFTAGISIVAALLFGTLPAWHTAVARRMSPAASARTAATPPATVSRQRIRGVLIVAETALAVVLLVGAGLLIRSFVRLSSVELGFDPPRRPDVQRLAAQHGEVRAARQARGVCRVVAAREVARHRASNAAGAIFGLPLTNFRYTISMSTLDGRALDNDEQTQRSLQVRVVTPDYFRSLGIPIVRGRAFDGNRSARARCPS